MTIIENMTWEMGLISVLVLGITVYLEITLLKFRNFEYCEINFFVARKPFGGFWFRIADGFVMAFYFSMYKSIEDYIQKVLGLNGVMMFLLELIILLGGIYGLSFLLNCIIKSSMIQFKELQLMDRGIERRLSVNIIINLVITLIIICGILFTSSNDTNRILMLMVTVVVAEAMLISSMKTLEHSVKINEKGIYFPHMNIKWNTIIDYEWEENKLILKRKPDKWLYEIKIDVDDNDVIEVDKFLLNKVLYKKLSVDAKQVSKQ
ncbi:hypothetical protein [Oceanirhabdus sp. W0125-5]|uniref:hypothetical protein n=1 Tax=Oceanirhabdus sp. W0125-5 TaxID=2999116 RepID=UPI0022F2F91A|nr:hypothetical protein [Oceanirhabdus sp. W0125-5]WBW96991.1 hypothetical protein OW730_25370 [Oceanirhabdus sp. W0125-5]